MLRRILVRSRGGGPRALGVRAAAYAAAYAIVASACVLLTGDGAFFGPLAVYALWLLPGYVTAAAAHPAKEWPFHVAAGFLYAIAATAAVGVPSMVLHAPFALAWTACAAVWGVQLAAASAWFCRLPRERVRDDVLPVSPPALDARWFGALVLLAVLPFLRGEVWSDGRVVEACLAIAVAIPFLIRPRAKGAAAPFWGPSTRTIEPLFLLSMVGLVILRRPHFWIDCPPASDTFHNVVLAQGMIGSPALNAAESLTGSGAPVPARSLLDVANFLVAIVAHASRRPAAPVMLTDLPVIVSIVIPCAAYALCDAVLGGRAWGYAGGALATLAYALFSGDRGRFPTTDLLFYLMRRLSLDNSLLVFVALPSAVACAIELWREWSWARWALYGGGCVALLALHPFGVPFLLFHIAAWTALAARPRVSRATVLIAGVPLALCAVVFWLRSRFAASIEAMDALATAELTGGKGVGIHTGSMFLAAPYYLLVLPPIAWVATRLRRLSPRERYLCAATIGPVVLAFVPPFPWALTRVIPPMVLYRVPWLMPLVPATVYALSLAVRSLPRPAASPAGPLFACAVALFVAVAPRFQAVCRLVPFQGRNVRHEFPASEVVLTARWVAPRVEGRAVLGALDFNNTLVLLRPGVPIFAVRAKYFFLQPFILDGRREEGEARWEFHRRVFANEETAEALESDLARFRVGMVVLRAKPDAALRESLGRLGWETAHTTPGPDGWTVLEPPSCARKTARD